MQVSGHVKRGDGAHSELRWIYVFAMWTKKTSFSDKRGADAMSGTLDQCEGSEPVKAEKG